MADLAIESNHYFLQGNRYFDNKQYDKAIISYTRAALHGEPNEKVYHNLAMSYYLKGDPQGALKNYAIAISIQPDFCLAYHGWGVCLSELGRYDEAILKFKKAVEIDPTYSLASLNWGLTLYLQKKKSKAKQVIAEGLKNGRLPLFPLFYRYKIELSLTEERFAKAANKEEKKMLKRRVLGYRWVFEMIPKAFLEKRKT